MSSGTGAGAGFGGVISGAGADSTWLLSGGGGCFAGFRVALLAAANTDPGATKAAIRSSGWERVAHGATT